MEVNFELKSRQTIETINRVLTSGAKKISVIIRHSDRFFSSNSMMDPFMCLTQEGKSLAIDFGTSLPETPFPRIFSSMIGRCIETAYLIDKGFTKKYNKHIDNIHIEELLAPFYVNDVEKAIQLFDKYGDALFIRKWFDNEISVDVMEDPNESVNMLCSYMTGLLDTVCENEIAICVSHDWSIYPLKEFKLGLSREDNGDVGYFEGVVFFEKEGQRFVTSYQTDPRPV